MQSSSSPSGKARAHIIIIGYVQGVSFRAWMLRQALASGVTGWVRNQPDGAVEAVIEGNRDEVERLVESAHSGPTYAEVEKITVSWEPYAGEYGSFSIH